MSSNGHFVPTRGCEDRRGGEGGEMLQIEWQSGISAPLPPPPPSPTPRCKQSGVSCKRLSSFKDSVSTSSQPDLFRSG